MLHGAAQLMRDNALPIRDALMKEVAKPIKDSLAEVLRSADLVDYTAEEGIRMLGEGKVLVSDSFPGQERTKLCLESRVRQDVDIIHLSYGLSSSNWGCSVLLGNVSPEVQ